jgi:hypothetical protein
MLTIKKCLSIVYAIVAGSAILSCVVKRVCAEQMPRCALVLGVNGSKSNQSAQDADDMATALRDLGFHVIAKPNPMQNDIRQALREFQDALGSGGVGVFYYVGHGAQVDGVDYLRPRGSKITGLSDIFRPLGNPT